jgi:hypothetical protein
MKTQLDGKVAHVIPTSGLLAVCARTLQPKDWDALASLATSADADDFEDMTEMDSEFLLPDLPSVRLSVPERQALLNTLSWPALQFILKLAREDGLSEGPALKAAVVDASGLERLKQILQKQFFAQAEIIKANTVLRKAWGPCNLGLSRLRSLESTRAFDAKAGEQSRTLLQGAGLPSATQEIVVGYIGRSLAAVRADMEAVNRLRGQLDALRHKAQSNFSALESDLEVLEAINSPEMNALPGEIRTGLLQLCGLNGVAPWQRLGLEHAPEDTEALIDRANDLLDVWEQQDQPGMTHRHLAVHARDRLCQILDLIE